MSTVSATLPLIPPANRAALAPLLADHQNEANAIEQQVEHLDRQLHVEREYIAAEFPGLFTKYRDIFRSLITDFQ
ncbi:hypothetical protein DFQ28_002828 [Apophysomyces sp. BC1034]|nr:hypothetical protein DFQ30_003106 [Apophysomyces sp. BC1015]KAG0179492.1 hypothetical protein DFQ29_002036 [Apophysomyces sp. BC1021]KAG0189853.1 hypothetical protein DFQ28_002828 [Apophysomyces sp. BC1034]